MHRLKGKSGLVLVVAVGVMVGLASAMLMLVFASATPPPYFIVIDQNGPNDESGQGDLTKMGRYDDPGNPLDSTDDALDIFWSWDDVGFSGQSGDACAQFGVPGSNPDKVAFVVCGQVHGAGSAGDPVKFSTVYSRSCNSGGTNSGDRCVNPSDPIPAPVVGDILAGDILDLDPNAVLITNDDPFPAGTGFPGDSTLRLRIKKSFLPANARLLNVCAFESTGGGGNNNPNDCITNEGGGFLVIKKEVNADLGAQFQFNVTGLPAGQNNPYSIAGGSQTSIGLPIGNHDVTEVNIPAGWELANASCVTEGGQSTGNINLPTVSGVNITAGLFTTCTFTNNAKPGKLTLVKVINNNNGGTASQSAFTPLIDGNPAAWGTSEIPLGQHTISEAAAAGYTMVSISGACASNGAITINPGDEKTCTITNDDNKPSLTLTKIVQNNDGGTASATDFTLSADGPTPISGAGGASSGNSFSAGTYTLSETNLSGYTASSWSCVKNGGNAVNGSSITLALGDQAACTITNDDQAGTLIVKKIVVNDNGGTKKVTDFTFKVNNAGAVAFQQDGDDLHGKNTLSRNAGLYTITEPAVAGYTTSYDGCANINLANGATATCTITNDDDKASLTLVKTVVNNNGGTATAQDWTLTADGGSAGILSGAGGAVSGDTFNAGTYALSESGPAGYTASAWVCTGTGTQNGAQITVGLGQSATCTITNNDNKPGLTLVKSVINNDGGTAVAANWTLTADGGAAGTLTGPGGAVSGDAFKAGTYALSESAGPAGYTASAWVCTGNGTQNGSQITLALGQSATCTITNNDRSAHLTLVKTVTNDNGGTASATDFTLSAAGPTPISGAGGAQGEVNAGSYTLSETNLPGYTPGNWSCVGGTQNGSSVALALGQSATCTINNNDFTAHLKLVKTVTNDNGGSASATDFTLSADGPTPIAGAGGAEDDVDAGTYDLSETSLPGYTAGNWSCVGGTQNGSKITLALHQTATCTINNNDAAPRLTLVKNLVNDNGGLAVAANWTLTANGGSAGILFGTGGAGSGSGFQAGTYLLSESAGPVGYSASPWTCSKNNSGAVVGDSISLAVGDTATCSITNDDIGPSLTLVKYVDNSTSNDASKDASDFLLSAVGTSASISGAGGVTSGPQFSAGTYTLSESNTLGYVGSAWSCSGGTHLGNTIALGVGQTATCSVLNTAVNVSPVIKVDKTATPANLPQSGGTVTFTMKVSNNSGSYDPFMLTSLTDNVYGDVTVLVEAGFKDQQSTTCSLPQAILAGGSYTCSFTANFAPIPNNTSFSEHDVVTASGSDDDNAGVSSFGTASDDAYVTMSPPIAVTRGTCSIYEFQRIFTPDIQNIPYYKLHATNPGQFFYNVSAFGDVGDQVEVTLTLPWSFVTQGNMPVHLYKDVGVVDPVTGLPYDGSSKDFCYVLGEDLGPVQSYVVTAADPLPPNTVQYGAITPGGTNYAYDAVLQKWVPKFVNVVLNITIPDSGMVFIRQHIDDGLKGPQVDVTGDGIKDSLFYGKGSGDNATNATTAAILIPENTEHPFSVNFAPLGDNLPGTVSLYNDNVFKKNTGVAGRITDENDEGVAGKQVNLYAGSSAIGPVIGSGISDEAGWYIIAYKHTGKAAQFTVELVPAGATVAPPNPVEITLKANGFAEVNFEIDLP